MTRSVGRLNQCAVHLVQEEESLAAHLRTIKSIFLGCNSFGGPKGQSHVINVVNNILLLTAHNSLALYHMVFSMDGACILVAPGGEENNIYNYIAHRIIGAKSAKYLRMCAHSMVWNKSRHVCKTSDDSQTSFVYTLENKTLFKYLPYDTACKSWSLMLLWREWVLQLHPGIVYIVLAVETKPTIVTRI